MARFYEKTIIDAEGDPHAELHVEIIFRSEEFSELKKADAADRVATAADKIKYASDLKRFEEEKLDKALADAAIAKDRKERTKRADAENKKREADKRKKE